MGDTTCKISQYPKGCEDKIKEFVSDNVMLVAGVAIGVGVFQVSIWILFISPQPSNLNIY